MNTNFFDRPGYCSTCQAKFFAQVYKHLLSSFVDCHTRHTHNCPEPRPFPVLSSMMEQLAALDKDPNVRLVEVKVAVHRDQEQGKEAMEIDEKVRKIN